ncbi:host attachment protein [uncultured Roseobacter sp.]|uniref:host attachment protein n=1 Tax=uncultured Roseobacter sp. TaxID=114847 RepID=UPI00261F8F99|nr:host attachment protein [uncultured Roseobacter sp.]
MKPVVTWVVLANARAARALENRGPGKGLVDLNGMNWLAEPATVPRDRAGVGHSSAGPGISAVEQSDPQIHADKRFAQTVSEKLSKAFTAKKFDRLVIVAGPRMMGLMRSSLDHRVRASVTGEIAKDLSALPLDVVETHLGEIIVV